jgi:hypothetical protein
MRRKPYPSVSLWLERGDEEVEVTAEYEPDTGGYVSICAITGPDGKPFDVTKAELDRLVDAAAEDAGGRALEAAERAAEGAEYDKYESGGW